MRKSSLFLSVVLTAFMLAVLAGVILSYQALAGGNTSTTSNNTNTALQANSVASDIGSQQAGLVAANFIGHNDLSNVVAASLFGTNTYKATFNNGDIVYVTPQGTVLAYALASSSQTGPSTGAGNSPLSTEHEQGDH
jgi:predicted Fe-Mo cluster-binding NifX family protein